MAHERAQLLGRGRPVEKRGGHDRSPDRRAPAPIGESRSRPAIRTLRLVIAYHGASFHGWQIQPHCPTIQGILGEKLAQILEEPVRIVGASRTDAGVHAVGQVASFATTRALSPLAIRSGLNALLPREIRISRVDEAPPGFDARRWARAKRYGYLIENSPVASPLLGDFAWHVREPLDRGAMAGALGALRGEHDFSAFCAAQGRARSPICRVFSVRLRSRRQFVALLISADSFLHHMVRNIVGSLVEVGKGRRPPEWMGEILRARDRRLAGPTAPPHGLVLLQVSYPPDRLHP